MAGAVMTMITALFTLGTRFAVSFENPIGALVTVLIAVLFSLSCSMVLYYDPWWLCSAVGCGETTAEKNHREDREALGDKDWGTGLSKKAKKQKKKKQQQKSATWGERGSSQSRSSMHSVVLKKKPETQRQERNDATAQLRKTIKEHDPTFMPTSRELQAINDVERFWTLNHAYSELLHEKGPLRKEGSLAKMSMGIDTDGGQPRKSVLEQDRQFAEEAASIKELRLHCVLTNLLGRKKASLQWRQRWSTMLNSALVNVRSHGIKPFEALEYPHPKNMENALHVAMQATAVMVHDNEKVAKEQAPLFIETLLSEKTLDAETDADLEDRRRAILYMRCAEGMTPLESGVKHHAPMEAIKKCLECMGKVDIAVLKDTVGLALANGTSLDVIVFLEEQVQAQEAAEALLAGMDAAETAATAPPKASKGKFKFQRGSVLSNVEELPFPSSARGSTSTPAATAAAFTRYGTKGGHAGGKKVALKDRRQVRSVSDLHFVGGHGSGGRGSGRGRWGRGEDTIDPVRVKDEARGKPPKRVAFGSDAGSGAASAASVAFDSGLDTHDTSGSSGGTRVDDGGAGVSAGSSEDGDSVLEGSSSKLITNRRSSQASFFGPPAKLSFAEAKHDLQSTLYDHDPRRGSYVIGNSDDDGSVSSADLAEFPSGVGGGGDSGSGARRVSRMDASSGTQKQQPRRQSSRVDLYL